jgi:protein SCO1
MMRFARTARWVAGAALLLLVVTGCNAPSGQVDRSGDATAAKEQEPVDHSHHGSHAHDHGAEHEALPADAPSDFSIYHATSVWTDQRGERRPLDSLGGRVQVVGMVYTNCAYACPRMVLDMKRIEGELGAEHNVGFVIVSIDPERDTPERLAEYAQGARLDPDRWTLLHGDGGDILELAALLGVQYRRMANGEFVHSNLLSVLDPSGQVAHRQMGLGTDPQRTLEVIRSLST